MSSLTDIAQETAPAEPAGAVRGGTEPAIPLDDPAVAVAELAGLQRPYLIGVRHHSPALSAVLPQLLDAARPEVLLLELPAEFAEWLPWLADPGTVAPVALAGLVRAAGQPDGGSPAFYPFADFSPELVAVRWAARNGVEVIPCDLPLADAAWHGLRATGSGPSSDSGPADSARATRLAPVLGDALRRSASGRADEDMWDRMVEARAPGADAEAVRRAALLVGWALRHDAETGEGVSTLDLQREAWMRQCLDQVGDRRVAALIGAFHAPALMPRAGLNSLGVAGRAELPATAAGPAATSPAAAGGEAADRPAARAVRATGGRTTAASAGPTVATSLVPYTFALLDARSGYPAGIRDPQWQQSVVGAAGKVDAIESAVLHAVVAVCARIRAGGHPSGPAEAREALRLATDLARLRGLPAPGRGELVEAMQSVLAHGEVLGRGRVVAKAMESVLVGDRRGRLAPGTPRSGLGPAVRDLLAELRLPGPGDPVKEVRLDPLRSELDRRRVVTLHRLDTCSVSYAEQVASEGVGGVDALTSRWRLGWTPQTDAMIEIAGLRGVTLAQATEGALREGQRLEREADGPTPQQVIEGLRTSANCSLPELLEARLTELAEVVPAQGTLPEIIAALGLLDQLRMGHVAGVPDPDTVRLTSIADIVETAAIRQLDGLMGSEQPADAQALAALAQRAEASAIGLRLTDVLARLSADGTPMMSAAAAAVQVLLGTAAADELGTRVASWVDAAGTPASRLRLQGQLTGLLVVAGPLLDTGGAVLGGLLDRVERLSDDDFLGRLPALRAGFHVVSPAARDRLLRVIDERIGGSGHPDDIGVVDSQEALLVRLLADRAGRQALEAYGLLPADPPAQSGPDAPDPAPAVDGPAPAGDGPAPAGDDARPALDGAPPAGDGIAAAQPAPVPAGTLAVADRWRLVLGRESDNLAPGARRYATALDELYGAGTGEGSRADAAARAGREAPFPGVREWAQELAVLFGPGVREEVLARAVEAGRLEAAMELDPEAVRPSVELLQTVLSLAGGLSESAVARLRPLVARIVADLTKKLATTLRPALTGLTTSRPTSRPGGRLDLPRTLRANLATSRRDASGRVVLVPERPVFRSRARRGVDWRLVLVVDVSGSMEASVIWSALTASVLAGVPALETHFIAFSTEVVDLTDRVHDPLGLLLEVKVGGGTHIAAGLRHARTLITVPSRTLVVVISDFEEGYPMGGLLGQVRALVEAGCTVLGCASLDDTGKPRYSVGAAGQLVAAGMPIAALSPLELARWVGEQVRR